MSGNGELILGQRFIEPSAGCEAKHYAEYVEQRFASDVSCDETRDLLAFFACGIEELVDRIVAYKFGKAGKIVRKR